MEVELEFGGGVPLKVAQIMWNLGLRSFTELLVGSAGSSQGQGSRDLHKEGNRELG
jgi:hypothetical protein